MFSQLQNLLDSIFSDISTTFITLFAIGVLVCGLMAAFGGEENQPKFKKGLVLCIFGVVAFTLAKPLITYLQTSLGA